ncbi:MAG: MBL fold metallo-hydrolase [Candidatus Verstraetearchaeota archaeon]|nr:MBL fold metallo-hydrolase [Candidatus Verstraetearchaeota archaeon]
MEIRILGGGMEVGKSAINLQGDKVNILMDYGAMIAEGKPEFPQHISPKEIDVIILSHAHLDHSGGIPLLYITERPKLITTQLTAEISELLIQDFIHLSGYYLPYEHLELKTMLSSVTPIFFREQIKIKNAKVRALNAGHIPGSIMCLIEVDGRKVLYTGDINNIETRLLRGAPKKLPKLDAIIMEGTYATTDHADRKKTEKEFITAIREVLNREGTVLVPAFSVGRAQEILCILEAYKISAPIYLDGMARKASRIMLRHSKYIKNYKLFNRAHERAKWITGWSQRKKACKKPGIIVSPAGMLKGGTAVFYMKRLARNERNAIFLVSYQIPGTPGRILLESGIYNFGRRSEKVKAEIGWFDFSSHSGRRELIEIIEKNKIKKVILVHGEGEALLKLGEELRDRRLAEDVIVAKNGEEIRV